MFTTVDCISLVQLLSRVRPFATPWTAARQASQSITNSRSLSKLMSIELVMPSSHLILCHPLFLLPTIPLSIRVFSNESTLQRVAFSHVHLFATLWTVAHQAPLSMGFSKQVYASGLLSPTPGDRPSAGLSPCLSHHLH